MFKDTLKSENILGYIEKLKKEAVKSTKKELNIDAYYLSKEEALSEPESPRAYARSGFKY